MKPRVLVGLDIGATKVACAIGRPAPFGNGIDVVGLGLVEHAAQAAAWPCEPAVLAQTIEQALQQAGAAHQPVDRAWVVLSHPDCAHHRVTVDLDLAEEPVMVRERDMARLKAQAVSHSLPLDRELLALSAVGYTGSGFEEVRHPHGLPTTRLRGSFHLVSLPLAVKRAVVEAVQAVGLEPERLSYSLDALAAACLDETQRRQRCVVIDVGGCSTQIGIVAHGVLEQAWTAPWGGTHLAAELARTTSVTMAQAVSHSLGGFSSSNAVVRDLLERQLQPVRSGLHAAVAHGPKPDAAVVSGRGALIDGMVEWVGDCLGLKAVLGRSARLKDQGHLSRQVAFSAVMGALTAVQTPVNGTASSSLSSNLLERVIDRTRRILVDYF